MKIRSFVLLAFTCSSLLAADMPATAPFTPDADGFIRNWLVLEPISVANLQQTNEGGRAAVDHEYFKDQLSVLPKAGDTVTLDGKSLQWHAVKAKDYIVDLTGFAAANNQPVTSELFWGVAYITSPGELKDIRLAIGSDDSSVWWVNGKEVIHAFGVPQTATDDNVSKRITLNKGLNVVRFAVLQGDGPSDCSPRFLDPRQKPITRLTISLDPPAAAPPGTAQ